MSRIGCGLTSGLVVVASAFSGFYWGAPYVLQYLGISESAHGSALFPLLLVCVACTLIGLLIGLFLYPLVLRPMLSPIEYWAWMDGERKIKYPPGINHVLEWWSVFVYGPKEKNGARSC